MAERPREEASASAAAVSGANYSDDEVRSRGQARRRVGAVVWHDEAAEPQRGAVASRHWHDGAAVPKGTTRHGQPPVGPC